MNDDESLAAVAGAVADGQVPDWHDLETAASQDFVEDVRQLRVIAEIAALHRRFVTGDHDARDADAEAVVAPEPGTSPERHWGPLVVLERLGEGTFGQVWRAWDTALDREVALKILRRRQHGAADGVVREGQLLARISHPNVMAIFGARVVDDEVGIWGEFLRGRTLARLVAEDGPLNADEALVVIESLSRALAAVHRAGLLHRDIKAENVMREWGGRIVLMDFGMGCLLDEATQQHRGIAGTPLYLAPELFRGGVATVRSDIYSLGVLMFHLVTGRYPLEERQVEALAGAHVAGRRLKVHDLRPDVPTGYVQVMERCLDADPGRRFESAGALQAAVVAARQAAPAPGTPDAARPSRSAMVGAALAGAVVVALLFAGWLLWGSGTASSGSRPPIRVSVEPPPGTRFSDSSRNMPAISPDGRFMATAATDLDSGRMHLWLHDFIAGDVRQLPDSERALAPFWASDSRSLGYFDPEGTIRHVTIEGVPIGQRRGSQEPRGASINREGALIFTKGPRSSVYVAAEVGGREERVVASPDPTRGELGCMWPAFLADGRRFVYFLLSDDPAVRGLYLGSLDGTSPRLLTRSDASGQVAGDRLLYVKAGNLVAQPFDADAAQVTGAPSTLVEGVAVNYDWHSVFSVSADGTLAYLPAHEQTELVWVDRDGAPVGARAMPPARYRSPVLSGDGRLLAVQVYRDGLSEIQVVDLASGNVRVRLDHSPTVQFPVWGPGHQLAYSADEVDGPAVYLRNIERDGTPRLLYAPPDAVLAMPTDWSSDGNHLLLTMLGLERRYGVWVVPVTRPETAYPLRPGEGAQVSGRFAPDGRRVVYIRRQGTQRSGQPTDREVWTCDFPACEQPQFVTAGGIDPAWPSNEEISLFDRASRLVILPIDGRGRVGPSQASLALGVNTPEAARNNYAWASDGRRLLVNRPARRSEDLRVMLLLGGPVKMQASDASQR